jgi:hypothetical protein
MKKLVYLAALSVAAAASFAFLPREVKITQIGTLTFQYKHVSMLYVPKIEVQTILGADKKYEEIKQNGCDNEKFAALQNLQNTRLNEAVAAGWSLVASHSYSSPSGEVIITYSLEKH